jgi:uncharacterized protein YuzE
MTYAFTEYFENKVLAKRPYLTKEMCIRTVERIPFEKKSRMTEKGLDFGQEQPNWMAASFGSSRSLMNELFTTHFLTGDLTMKIEYFPETDSLYVDLADRPGSDTREIGEGIILDIDVKGRVVGIDIDQASKHISLDKLNLKRIPFDVEQTAS